MANTSTLKRLLAQWGARKTAKRFGVSERTVKGWQRNGLPSSRRVEVEATARRVERAVERAAVNDDWAREVLARWVESGNDESDAMIRIRELSTRRRRSARDEIAIETWKGLLDESRNHRRELGKVLHSRRFRATPTGRSVGELTAQIDEYSARYHQAIKRDNPREISIAWKNWERQVKRLAGELEGLQIPGMSKRQVYTLFFSP